MNSSDIPSSVKSPWSLQADYANPILYGWIGIIGGALWLFLGAMMLLLSTQWFSIALAIALGVAFLSVGVWMVKRGE